MTRTTAVTFAGLKKHCKSGPLTRDRHLIREVPPVGGESSEDTKWCDMYMYVRNPAFVTM